MTDPERPRTTPEGHTPEEPRPSELGKPGTPGAGMSADVPHAADARRAEEGETTPAAAGEPVGEAHAGVRAGDNETAQHAAESHMAAHTTLSDDDHAHAEPRLGPIDWPAWGYALIGVAAGLLVVVLFFVAIGGQPG
ncbi:hypothetical protein BH24CHL6_BH24CHL6_10840 [soil metagenome]